MKKFLIIILITVSVLIPWQSTRGAPPATNLLIFFQRKIEDVMPVGIVPDKIIIVSTKYRGIPYLPELITENISYIPCAGVCTSTYNVNGGVWGKLKVFKTTALTGNVHHPTADQYKIYWESVPYTLQGHINIITQPINDNWISIFRGLMVDPVNTSACNPDLSVCRKWSDRNYLYITNKVTLYWLPGLKKEDFDESKIYSLNPGTIYGDIGARGSIDPGQYIVEDNAILAAGGAVSGNTGVKLGGYNFGGGLAWAEIKKILDKTRGQLINERAKYWCGRWNVPSDPKQGCNDIGAPGPTQISGDWYLQNGRANNKYKSNKPDQSPFGGYTSPPEGEVWYIKGNLIIGPGTKYHGRGTVIVEGNLTIQGNIMPKDTSSTSEDMIGFIVVRPPTNPNAGRTYITVDAEDVQAAIFAEGDKQGNKPGIIISDRYKGALPYPLNFVGLLASQGKIELPFKGKGGGSSFMYDGRLAENPLPGFKQIMGSLITQKGETTP